MAERSAMPHGTAMSPATSMTTYRLQYAGGAPVIRILADEGEATRELATCRGSGDRWPQAVKDAELIVAALNAYPEGDNA